MIKKFSPENPKINVFLNNGIEYLGKDMMGNGRVIDDSGQVALFWNNENCALAIPMREIKFIEIYDGGVEE